MFLKFGGADLFVGLITVGYGISDIENDSTESKCLCWLMRLADEVGNTWSYAWDVLRNIQEVRLRR